MIKISSDWNLGGAFALWSDCRRTPGITMQLCVRHQPRHHHRHRQQDCSRPMDLASRRFRHHQRVPIVYGQASSRVSTESGNRSPGLPHGGFRGLGRMKANLPVFRSRAPAKHGRHCEHVRQWHIAREDQDRSRGSHQKAAAAGGAGFLLRPLIPLLGSIATTTCVLIPLSKNWRR